MPHMHHLLRKDAPSAVQRQTSDVIGSIENQEDTHIETRNKATTVQMHFVVVAVVARVRMKSKHSVHHNG